MTTSIAQTELFGEGPGTAVDLAPEARRWARVADHLPTTLRLGTSSWSFPGWYGSVYDRKTTESVLARHGLFAYGKHPLFRTVGLDRSYYQPIHRETYAHYAQQVPDDFQFLVKAERRLTTPGTPDFLNPDVAHRLMIQPLAEGMGSKVGVLLFQFPPFLASDVGGGDGFARSLDSFFQRLNTPIPLAVELRSASLLTGPYCRVLEDHGIAHSYVAHPSMPPVSEQITQIPPSGAPLRVVRWMLAAGRSYNAAREAWQPFATLQAPDPDTRTAVVDLVRGGGAGSQGSTFVVVNNKAEGSSPRSIEALVEAMLVVGRDGR